ncbi:MAG: hypothetical protein LBO69_06755 [Ignavibacteria bacterium]|nr:hypothetical protein [Ignavibacteria bacterium]
MICKKPHDVTLALMLTTSSFHDANDINTLGIYFETITSIQDMNENKLL